MQRVSCSIGLMGAHRGRPAATLPFSVFMRPGVREQSTQAEYSQCALVGTTAIFEDLCQLYMSNEGFEPGLARV